VVNVFGFVHSTGLVRTFIALTSVFGTGAVRCYREIPLDMAPRSPSNIVCFATANSDDSDAGDAALHFITLSVFYICFCVSLCLARADDGPDLPALDCSFHLPIPLI